MRDWESERPVKKGVRIYGARTVRGRISPYNELVDKLGEAAQKLQHEDRRALQRLAWFLGMNGETHACEAIMAHAKEPSPYAGAYMYGVGLR